MKKGALILFCLAMMGIAKAQQQGNHWTPVGLEHNMTVSGIILIDGTEQMVSTLEVGAFCGEQCRGSRRGQYFSMTGQYVVPLQIQGNVNGEVITFRLYDHVTQQELELESVNTLEFEINGRIGAPGNWYPFSFNTPAQTFSLNIAGYGGSTGGYYLIAPPVDDVDPAQIEGMTEGDFDLYYFDEAESGEEWRNYEAGTFNLVSGKGYLYAHKTDVTLSFTGTPYSGNGQVTLSKTEGVPLSGWNLVGNPFAQQASIDRECYVMNGSGTEIIASDSRTVAPMQGVFVIAATDGEEMTFVPESNTDQGSKIVLNVSRNRSAAIDRAIVRLEGHGTLPKFMLHPENTKLYIPGEGTDYAVMTRSGDNSTPVNFKARENGSYTINIDVVNADMDYLHLVDNKTGADVDLLQTPSYTFTASVTDYPERFSLVYETTTGLSEEEVPFAYYADGEIRLTETEYTSLQIVDMTGRVLVRRDVFNASSSSLSTEGMTPGVYVLRLINGDNVKTQKIVVK